MAMMAPVRDRIRDWRRILEIRRIERPIVLSAGGTLYAIVTEEDIGRVIDLHGTTSDIAGLFVAPTDRGFVAVDNRDGHAWTEDFRTLEWAVRWLTDRCVDTEQAHERDEELYRRMTEGEQ